MTAKSDLLRIAKAPISLYGILDTSCIEPDQFATYADKLIKGGAGILQIRAKHSNTAERIRMANAVLPVAQSASVPLIINDDLDAVLNVPGTGLHIGQDDMPPSEARNRLGPNRIIGLSTHSREQAEQAEKLAEECIIDYFAIGPVFATPTKPDYVPVTPDLVQWAVTRQFKAPCFFIGGITRNTLPIICDLGARRVVIVSALLKAADPEAETRACLDLMASFDGNCPTS
ncbi:MAG: Thiamine-phosphate synthase [Verrucomicrobia bacterium ADurb.Bin474]|nr:MAG: Thiamine-phosphate synthase [Verrucomicrobia bacterium ADurb.Bin474]